MVRTVAREWCCSLTRMPDRSLIIATGAGLLLVDPDTGATRKEIDLGSSGWAAVAPANDAGHVLLGNFFTGEFVKLRLADGQVVARSSIKEKNSLSGIAQYAGRKVIRQGPGFGAGNPYEAIIESSEKAFMQRDLEGSIENIDEDYVLYDIKDEGPVARMRGKENVRKILGAFFSASDSWLDSEVDKWGLLDNILVQVEYDTYEDESGTRTIPTLVVFRAPRWQALARVALPSGRPLIRRRGPPPLALGDVDVQGTAENTARPGGRARSAGRRIRAEPEGHAA